MKSTGIIRRMDELGRVVVPIEIRNQFNIAEKDPIEIYVEGEKIVLKKPCVYFPQLFNCSSNSSEG